MTAQPYTNGFPMTSAEQDGTTLKNVVFFNDDVTSAEYVEFILNKVFDINERSAWKLVERIDREGSAVVATLEAADADAKVVAVNEYNAVMGCSLQVKTRDIEPVAGEVVLPDGEDEILTGYAVVLKQTCSVMNKEALVIINQKFGALKDDDATNLDFEDLKQGREIVWRLFDGNSGGDRASRLAMDMAEHIVDDYNDRCEASDDFLCVERKSPGDVVSKKNVVLPSFEEADDAVYNNFGSDLAARFLERAVEKAGSMEKIREKIGPEHQEGLDELLKYAGRRAGPKP